MSRLCSKRHGGRTGAVLVGKTERHLAARDGYDTSFTIFALIAGVLLTAIGAAADEPDGGTSVVGTNNPLQFRRVYAPADRRIDWPRDPVPYLPIDAETFEELLRKAQGATTSTESARGASVVSAEYEARLEGNDLLVGTAVAQVEHTAETPTLLSLQPCRLAVANPLWQSTEPMPAVMGLGADGTLGVRVEQSASLAFDWTFRGHRNGTPVTEFPLEFPACPSTRLVLDLPDDLVPEVDGALVSPIGDAVEGRRQWRIEVGGHHRFLLRIAPVESPSPAQSRVSVRQSTRYHLKKEGLEVQTRLELDVAGDPLSRLTVRLDPGLQLVDVRLGETIVPWLDVARLDVTRLDVTRLDPAQPASPAGKVVLELPEVIRGTGRTLQLRAVAPLQLDRRWRLPTIGLFDGFWQEGVATLAVDGSLRLQAVTPDACWQTGISRLPAPQGGETLDFQASAADASLGVTVTRRQSPLRVDALTIVELGATKTTGRVALLLTVADGRHFEFEADVAQRWIVDAVEADPPEALDDWTEILGPARRRKLRISLAKAVTPGRPIRLTILGRDLRSPVGRDLTLATLSPLRLADGNDGRRTVAVSAAQPYHLRVTGTEQIEGVRRAHLPRWHQEILKEPPGCLLLENNLQTKDVRVRLAQQQASYTGTIRVEASVSDGRLDETYWLRCVPQASGVERIVVHFSQRRGAPPQWTLGTEGAEQLTAVPLDDAAEDPTSGGETWEVVLPRPRSVPFDLRASRSVRLADEQPIGLAWLPEAVSQRATLVIRAAGATPLRIDNRHLYPVPTAAAAPDRQQTARAAYRYEPARHAGYSAAPAVSVSLEPKSTTPTAWAWSCQLQSRFDPDGQGSHLVTYRMESVGGEPLQLTLPPTATADAVRGVWIDGTRTAWQTADDEADHRLTVALPTGRKFSRLSVYFLTAGAKLGILGRLDAPLPEAHFPVLTRHWTVWLPPGFQRLASPADLGGPGKTVTQRLFGPLGRGRADGPAGNDESLRLPHQSTETAGNGSPWRGLPPMLFGAKDTRGWTMHDLEIPASQGAQLTVVDRGSIYALGWIAFLATVSLGRWLLIRRPVGLVLLAGLFGVVALVLPDPLVPPASGAVLGTLFALTWGLARRRDALAPSHDEKSEPSTQRHANLPAVSAGVVALIVVAILSVCAHARGDPTDTPPQTPATIHRLFIPVDDKRQPTGDQYDVPAALYNALRHRADALTGEPQWVLGAGAYRGNLVPRVGRGGFTVADFKASYDLLVIGKPAHIHIPLQLPGANLLPGGATLDGRTILAEWGSDGKSLILNDVPEPGSYRLELSLQPALRDENGSSGFDLLIPRLVTSTLELNLPPGAPPIRVPTAVGSVVLEEGGQRLVADLGPTDRLGVDWAQSEGLGGDRTVTTEELYWVKIRPGSVVIDARLTFRGDSSQLARVLLAADPRLRMLPVDDANTTIVAVQVTPGNPQMIEMELAETNSNQVVVEATFLLSGASGVGNLRFPHLQTQDTRPTARWVAVTVDPSLQYKMPSSEETDVVPVADFSASWGASEAKPQWVYRLAPNSHAPWLLTTSRVPNETVADQVVAVSFDLGEAEIHYQAELTPSRGRHFQHRLQGPPGMKIDSVSVLAGEEERAVRWSGDPTSGLITVFLSEPVSGRHELMLRGRLSYPAKKTMPLPVVTMTDCQIRSTDVAIFRQPAVSVPVTVRSGLRKVEAPNVNGESTGLGRLHEGYTGDGKPIDATVSVGPNLPDVVADQVTRLVWDGQAWRLHLDVQVDVRDGWLDSIRFDVPPEWIPSEEVEPAARATVTQVLGTDRRQLVVRPPHAIQGPYRLRVSGELKRGLEDQLRVPPITMRSAKDVRQYVILPSRYAAKAVRWETQGLQKTTLPEELDGASSISSSAEVYRVTDENFLAVLKPAERSVAEARVDSAEIQVAWDEGDSYVGVAAITLEPARLSEVFLIMPQGQQPLAVFVAGVPTAPEATRRPDRFRVPLGPAALPQRIEVLFSGTLSSWTSSRHRRFDSPSLEDLPAQRTLWRISGPGQWEPTQGLPNDELQRLTPLEYDLTRIQDAAAAVQRSAASLLDDPEAKTPWYRRWATRLTFAEERIRRLLDQTAQSPQDVETAVAALDTIEGQQVEITRDLEIDRPTGASGAVEPTELWCRLLDHRLRSTHLRLQAGTEAPTVGYRSKPSTDLGYRLLLAAAVIGAILLAVLGWQWPTARAWLRRWPGTVAVLVGIAWWLWLALPFLGILIALAGVIRCASRLRGRGHVVPVTMIHADTPKPSAISHHGTQPPG